MSRFLPTIGRCWLAEELYGWKFAPLVSASEAPYLYAKCLLHCARATPDRPAQRAYVSGLVQATFAGDVDSDLVHFIDHFAPLSAAAAAAQPGDELASPGGDVVPRSIPPAHARVLVYDCVMAAVAGGFALWAPPAAGPGSPLPFGGPAILGLRDDVATASAAARLLSRGGAPAVPIAGVMEAPPAGSAAVAEQLDVSWLPQTCPVLPPTEVGASAPGSGGGAPLGFPLPATPPPRGPAFGFAAFAAPTDPAAIDPAAPGRAVGWTGAPTPRRRPPPQAAAAAAAAAGPEARLAEDLQAVGAVVEAAVAEAAAAAEVRQVAKALGVNAATVERLADVAKREAALQAVKRRVIFPHLRL